jgi:type IV secretory pathway VirB10-like protein
MEQQSSKPLALVLGLPLVAIALAVVFSYFMTGDKKPAPEPATAPTQFALPPAPLEEPAAPVARPPATPQAAPTPGAAPTPTPPAPTTRTREVDAAAEAEQFKNDPKLREHAQLMSTESARMLMQQGNLEGLRRLRDALRDQRVANVISPIDLEAMDVGIDCMARGAGFRQHADDFLDDHPSSSLAESVRAVCR